jgi:Cof subfamily protein (haloacid dehalogenase superfamily)
VKLIASDLDGTLLIRDGENLSISERTVQAVHAAQDAGIKFAVCTGRQLWNQPEAVDLLNPDYVVSSNGAIARDRDWNILFSTCISPETQRAIVSYYSEHLPGLYFGTASQEEGMMLVEPGYQELAQHEDGQARVAPLDEVIGKPTLKLMARSATVTAAQMQEALDASGLTGFHGTTSGAPFVEIMGEGVDKASGLAKLAAHMGIGRENVMCAGDAWNDIEMLSWAGLGVAMGDGEDDAKAAADVVTGDLRDDGLAQAIEEVLAER